MNRLQKKCFLFSMGVHGLLAVILLATAAFRPSPPANDSAVMEFIPAKLLDRAGAGGGSMAMAIAPQPQSQSQRQYQPPQQPAPVRTPEPVEHLTPRAQPARQHEPTRVREETDVALERDAPSLVPVKKHHQIKPTFTPADRSSTAAKTSESRSSAAAERAAARSSEARRLQAIENAFSGLASNVRNRTGQIVAADLPGVGGGEAFAGYETAIREIYRRAWSPQGDLDDRLANVDAKIVVARDGSILSAEVVSRSGHRDLDHSVEQVLRAVAKLPPFPESAQDAERSFLIRFNLEAKELSG